MATMGAGFTGAVSIRGEGAVITGIAITGEGVSSGAIICGSDSGAVVTAEASAGDASTG